MKAIPMREMCASCHGNNVNKSLKSKINHLYPEDIATGFMPGDVRGAFTLSKHKK